MLTESTKIASFSASTNLNKAKNKLDFPAPVILINIEFLLKEARGEDRWRTEQKGRREKRTSSSNNSNFFVWLDGGSETPEHKVHALSVSEAQVLHSNLSFIWPIRRCTENKRKFSFLFHSFLIYLKTLYLTARVRLLGVN
jgi:hypothetical protein